MRFFHLITVLVAAALSGCFWESSPPDLSDDDRPVSLVVIWDQPVDAHVLHRVAWETTDAEVLASLMQTLDTTAWRSSSVLPPGHSTRIIISMASGRVWEVVQTDTSSKALALFDREDRGTSGRIPWSASFMDRLTQAIGTEHFPNVDLARGFRKEIRDGKMTKTVTAQAKSQLARFPGFPEVIWDPDEKKWRYAAI